MKHEVGTHPTADTPTDNVDRHQPSRATIAPADEVMRTA